MKGIVIDIINVTAYEMNISLMNFIIRLCCTRVYHNENTGFFSCADVKILTRPDWEHHIFYHLDLMITLWHTEMFNSCVLYITFKGYYTKTKTCVLSTYNLNFSFHFGLNVCGLMDVARINFAGTGPPPRESRCSRRPPSFRLKLSRKLWCFLNLSWCGESRLLSKPTSDNVRGVNGGCGEIGAPAGCIPSMQ